MTAPVANSEKKKATSNAQVDLLSNVLKMNAARKNTSHSLECSTDCLQIVNFFSDRAAGGRGIFTTRKVSYNHFNGGAVVSILAPKRIKVCKLLAGL